jgi:hypothetical protein
MPTHQYLQLNLPILAEVPIGDSRLLITNQEQVEFINAQQGCIRKVLLLDLVLVIWAVTTVDL